MKFMALCALGLEKLVKDELKALKLEVTSAAPGKVVFEGPWEAVYRTNLHLRTCERVLLLVGEFVVRDFDQLFEGMNSIAWEDFLTPKVTVKIEKVRSRASAISSVPALQSVSQKAIFQRLQDKWKVKTLPQTGPEIAIRIYLDRDRCQVGLDTSGDGLHKRGYRKMTSDAPLKETIAAALLLWSGWRRKNPLHDPFCGSGTLLIEAALYAFNIPPGLHRRFAFEHLNGYSGLEWSKVKEQAKSQINMEYKTRISGSDRDKNVLVAARANLQAWGLEDHVTLTQMSMEEARATGEPGESGFVITNPPYGERLETKEQAENLSRQMRHFTTSFPDWKIGVITPLENFPELFARKPLIVRDLHNGSSEAKYYQF